MYRRFVALLQERKVTPYRVSKETGIPASTFTDWKTGRSAPKIDKLLRLSEYFGVSVNHFIEGDTKSGDADERN